jgi:hypothetical protein
MKYAEETHEIGDLRFRGTGQDVINLIELEGDYGTAVSLVATLEVGSAPVASRYLWAWLVTGMDGNAWVPLDVPGAGPYMLFQSGDAGGGRFHGPFGNKLALRAGVKNTNQLNDQFQDGSWSDVTLTLGVQRV